MELRGLARTMKNSLDQTLQLALRIRLGSVLLASAKPRLVRWTSRWWSGIHHSIKRVSTSPESNVGELRLVCGCSATETHFMKLWTVIVLMLIPEAVWNLVVSVATEDRWFLRTALFIIQQSRSVSLCGPPLRGWVVGAPRCFHFTVDRGRSSRANWPVEKVASYDGAMLKVTELFSTGHSTANVCL
jgi:hypothetical protein